MRNNQRARNKTQLFGCKTDTRPRTSTRTHLNTAHSLYDRGYLGQAMSVYRAALTAAKSGVEGRLTRAIIYRHMGDCLHRDGKFLNAERAYRRALRVIDRRCRKIEALKLSWLLRRNIADCRYNRDDIINAAAMYRTAERLRRRWGHLHKIKSATTRSELRNQTERARFLGDLADCYRRMGDITQARLYYKQCIDRLTDRLHPGTMDEAPLARKRRMCTLGDALEGLAETYFREQNYQESLRLFEQALDTKSRVWGPADPGLRDVWFRLSEIHLHASQPTEAITYIERLMPVLLKFEPEAATTAQLMQYLAQSLASCKRHAEAATCFEYAAASMSKYLPPESSHLRQCLLGLANSYCWLERFVEAESVARQILQDDSRKGLALQTARAERTMGISLAGQRKYTEAQPHHQSAVEMFNRIKGEADPETRSAREHLERTLSYVERIRTTAGRSLQR